MSYNDVLCVMVLMCITLLYCVNALCVYILYILCVNMLQKMCYVLVIIPKKQEKKLSQKSTSGQASKKQAKVCTISHSE